MDPSLTAFAAGQVVTVFRSRLRPEHEADYHRHAQRVADLAATMPGLVEFKTFSADDGERVTVVTFADGASQQEWAEDLQHRLAQEAGRSRYYSRYSIQVCRADRVSIFPGGDQPSAGDA